MNYKKYDTGGNIEEEKEYSPAKSWAMARARLGIAGSQEEQALKRAQKLWSNYLSDIQDSRLQAFKDRNLYSTIGSKLLGGAGYLLGGADIFKDMKWVQPALTTLGATTGRYAGTLAADPTADEYQPDYKEFADEYDISGIEEGRFFKGDRESFKEGTGIDIDDMKDALAQAFSDEQTMNILSGMTDVYNIHKLGEDADLEWLYNMFGNTDDEIWDPEGEKKPWEV